MTQHDPAEPELAEPEPEPDPAEDGDDPDEPARPLLSSRDAPDAIRPGAGREPDRKIPADDPPGPPSPRPG